MSYAWGGRSEQIVNELDTAFKNENILLVRDKRDLGFKGIITEFMQQLGEGKAVVTVVSGKYLKSPYCMFEHLEIYRNLSFKDRVFPIILEDAHIFDPLDLSHHIQRYPFPIFTLTNLIEQINSAGLYLYND